MMITDVINNLWWCIIEPSLSLILYESGPVILVTSYMPSLESLGIVHKKFVI